MMETEIIVLCFVNTVADLIMVMPIKQNLIWKNINNLVESEHLC